MFTCHDHMRDLFCSLGCDVLILPHHRDVVENGAVPERYHLEARPVPVSKPVPVATVLAPVVTASPRNKLTLEAEQFDSELKFEMSAIDHSDSRRGSERRGATLYGHSATDERNDEFWDDFDSKQTA